MTKKISLPLAALCLLAAAAAAHSDSGKKVVKLPLADALAMALAHNADLRVESLNSAMSAADIDRSRGIYDPTLSLAATGGGNSLTHTSGMSKNATATVGVTQLLPTGGSVTVSTQTGLVTGYPTAAGTPASSWQSSAGLVVTQPLLRNAGKEITEVSIVLAQNALQDTLDRFRFSAIDTSLQVVTAYNRLFALREERESKKASLDMAQKLLDETRAKSAAGGTPQIDITNAEFGVVQRRKDLVDAERTLRDQETAVRYLIGMRDRGDIIPVDPPSREEPQGTEDQAVKTALELRLDLKQLRSQLKSARVQESAARNQTLPDLSIVAGGGVLGGGGTFPENLQQMRDGKAYWSAGLQLTMPLGNRAAEADYRKSRIRSQQIEAQIDALSWKIENDIQGDMRSLMSARLQVQVARKALEQSRQRLEEYHKNNKAGSATSKDVLDAETDLGTACTAEIEAMEGYADAVAKLWRDTGEILDRLHVRIDTSEPAALMKSNG